MTRTATIALLTAVVFSLLAHAEPAQAQQAYGNNWAHSFNTQDWQRFYHYPYVYYPQNFWGSEYYRSSESMYHRYPPEMRVPVYNKQWHNYYPDHRTFHNGRDFHAHRGPRYYSGAHFNLDVF